MSARFVSSEDRDSFPTVEDYLRLDSGQVPDALFERSSTDLGNEPVHKDLFISKAVADLEAEKLWPSVWQMACRENEIPRIGDRTTYDILDQSFVLVRVKEEEIKAFYNVCMHRGTRLVGELDPKSGNRFSCSFHNWTYNLDGSIKNIPCRWDFPEVSDADAHLKEVRVGRWNGFVFINLDPDCEPLEQFLGKTILRHFENWSYEHAAKIAHLGKVIPVNWKVALSAFQEVYHINRTHAGFLHFSGDCNAQYDAWGEHARQILCIGVPSPHLGDVEDMQMILEGVMESSIANLYGHERVEIPELPEGAGVQDVRRVCAEIVREGMKARTGVDFSDASDSEMLDAIHYFIFPNIFVFGGKAFPICYRVTPVPGDHESCLFEAMAMTLVPERHPLPRDVPMITTPPDQPWAALSDVMGRGVEVLDEDMVNLNKFQAGLHQNGFQHVRFSNYQERNIRNFIQCVEKRIYGN